MAKASDAPPPGLDPSPDEAPETAPARAARTVFADERLLSANQIVRILNDLEAPERRAVMQIVNILVEVPTEPTKESE